MTKTPNTLAVSDSGRFVVWVAQWSWSNQATGMCVFSDSAEAINYARCNATGFVDWGNFPDRHRKYPDDDRDGTETPKLNPLFIARWDGGSSEVTEMEISDVWYAAKDMALDGAV